MNIWNFSTINNFTYIYFYNVIIEKFIFFHKIKMSLYKNNKILFKTIY